MDWATDSEIGAGSGMPGGSGRAAGRGLLFERGFRSTGATAVEYSSGGAADLVKCVDVELDVLGSTASLGLAFFSSVVRTGGSSSTGRVDSGACAVLRFGAVAGVREFGSVFFFFDLEGEVISPV
jgi:hypothetical protein